MKLTMKKAALAAAVISTLGLSASASADSMIELNWSGLFTMQTPTGAAMTNTSYASSYDWYGARTPVAGTMTFNTTTGAGTATMNDFFFFDSPIPAQATGITLQAIGDGFGGAGTLVLANLGFNWGGNYGIPVSLVLDAAGFFTNGAVMATPASDMLNFGTIKKPVYMPIGPALIATTTWNTTTICGTLGCNPSGGLGLIADATNIGGSPMVDGPFPGYNANFDITGVTVTAMYETGGNPVPVPAAAWLLGSGLLGLVGVARRKVVA